MALNLSARPQTVEIDGNEYKLPTALTPKIRGEAAAEEKAYLEARLAGLKADLSIGQAKDVAGAVKANKASSDAERAVADAARAFLGVILKTPEGQPVDASVLDGVADPEAVDIADKLIEGARLDLDPQPAT